MMHRNFVRNLFVHVRFQLCLDVALQRHFKVHPAIKRLVYHGISPATDDVDELKLLESQKKKQVEGAIWESSTYSIAVVNAQYLLFYLISNLLVFPRTAYPVYISYVLSTSVAVAVVLLGIKFSASMHGDLDNHVKESQKSRSD